MFKANLDEGLSKLIKCVASLPMVGGVELKDLTGPFQPTLFCDSLNCLGYNFCISLVKGNEIFQLISPEIRWLLEKLQMPLTL